MMPLLLLLLVALCARAASAELVHVHVMFRHGDRSPVIIYPKDPHQVDAWPYGLGQLTRIGMNQHFALGRFLRKRYAGLLQDVYNVSQLYVRSSDVDRTLMSAESNLAGLFLPTSPDQQFNKELRWNPVPIHTVPEAEDDMLTGGEYCQRASQIMNEINASPAVQKVQESYKSLFDKLRVETGMLDLNITNTWVIVDVTICEQAHNFSTPDWITDEVWRTMRDIDQYAWDLKTSTPELRRLRGGVLLYRIRNHFQALTHSPPVKFSAGGKMIMYSGHDFTISDFLSSVGADNGVQPPYATAVLVELHREAGGYFVRIFLRNDSTHEPYPMTMAGCNHSCPVEDFMRIASADVLPPSDYSNACKIVSNGDLSRDLSFGFGFLSIIGVVCVLLIILASLIRRTRYRRYRRMDVQSEEGHM